MVGMDGKIIVRTQNKCFVFVCLLLAGLAFVLVYLI